MSVSKKKLTLTFLTFLNFLNNLFKKQTQNVSQIDVNFPKKGIAKKG